jgi:hypothetical protein
MGSLICQKRWFFVLIKMSQSRSTKYVQSLFERAQIYSVPLGHGIEDEDLKMKEGQDIMIGLTNGKN